jgi:hypothetical protein
VFSYLFIYLLLSLLSRTRTFAWLHNVFFCFGGQFCDIAKVAIISRQMWPRDDCQIWLAKKSKYESNFFKKKTSFYIFG